MLVAGSQSLQCRQCGRSKFNHDIYHVVSCCFHFLILNLSDQTFKQRDDDSGFDDESLNSFKTLPKYRQIKSNFMDYKSNIHRGSTALIEACRNGDKEQIACLLEAGVEMMNACDNNGATALFVTSEIGDFETAKLLISKGAIVDKPNKDFWTPLFAASVNGFYPITKLLLRKGANVKHRDRYGSTALNYAASSGHVKIAKLLIENGACIDHLVPLTPLMEACYNGHREMVRILLQKGANLYTKSSTVGGTDVATGSTALVISAQKGHYDIMNILIDASKGNFKQVPMDLLHGKTSVVSFGIHLLMLAFFDVTSIS